MVLIKTLSRQFLCIICIKFKKSSILYSGSVSGKWIAAIVTKIEGEHTLEIVAADFFSNSTFSLFK
jgi:hypothetical protein